MCVLLEMWPSGLVKMCIILRAPCVTTPELPIRMPIWKHARSVPSRMA